MKKQTLLLFGFLLLLNAISGCKKNESNQILQCDDYLLNDTTYNTPQVTIMAGGQLFIDTATGISSVKSSSAEGTRVNLSSLFGKLRSTDANALIDVSFAHLYATTADTVTIQQVYDTQLAPGNYPYKTYWGKNGVYIRFADLTTNKEYLSKTGDNTNSTFTIVNRGPIFYSENKPYCYVSGNFCCFCYDYNGVPKSVTGRFKGPVMLY